MKKIFLLMGMLLMSVILVTNASAIYVTGGDAESHDAADDILDIVFVFDTSGSMHDEIGALVPAMENIVRNIDCPDCDVWVRATLMGITGGPYGLTDYVTRYVYDASGSTGNAVSNSSEDNAPAVEDMVNWFDWNDTSSDTQDYYKAIVTIGDEGTENGHPVNEADWTAAQSANAAAIDNDVMVFSVLGTPYYTTPAVVAARNAVFTALAVGGVDGFGDTGGTVTHTTTSTIEADIEAIICTAAGGGTGGGDGAPVPEPATMLLLGSGLAGLVCAKRKKLLKKQ